MEVVSLGLILRRKKDDKQKTYPFKSNIYTSKTVDHARVFHNEGKRAFYIPWTTENEQTLKRKKSDGFLF